MSTYIVFFLFLFGVGLLQFTVKEFKRYYQVTFTFIFFLMLLAASLRSTSVSFDGEAYKAFFDAVPPITNWWFSKNELFPKITSVEPSFVILSGISKLFSDHISVLFFIYALIAVGCHFYSFYRYLLCGSINYKRVQISGLVFLAIILYYTNAYIVRDLGVMRFGAACAVGLLTVEPVYERNHLRFFMLTGIATFLHTVGLVLFFPWILSFTKLVKSQYAMLASLVVSIFIGHIGISHYIVSYLPSWPGYLTDKILRYADSEYALELGILSSVNMLNISIFSILLCSQENLEKKNKFFNTLMLFFVSGMYTRLIFNDYGILGGRIGNLLTSVDVILLPLILFLFTQKTKIIVWIVIGTLSICQLYANIYFRQDFGEYLLGI